MGLTPPLWGDHVPFLMVRSGFTLGEALVAIMTSANGTARPRSIEVAYASDKRFAFGWSLCADAVCVEPLPCDHRAGRLQL